MTPRRAQFLRAFCHEFGAFAQESFWQASGVELAAACNGVGPDCWPAWLRYMFTWLLRPLEASAMIHDMDYSMPDKTFRSFTAANARLAANCTKEALYDARPAAIPLGFLAALLCQLFGWNAYRKGSPSR